MSAWPVARGYKCPSIYPKFQRGLYRLGIGISVATLLYVYDLMARVVPDLKDAIFISPFSYSNATSIFAGESRDCVALILGTIMIVIMTVGAGMIYAKRDLAS